jgi:transcriptional regulator with GAF, ATPase, and Fis domain
MGSPRDRSDLSTALRPKIEAPHTTASGYALVVVEGPDRGVAFNLDGSQPTRALIGKSPACHFRLNDPMVSRRHCALDLNDKVLRLTDLDSTNGTFANGIACGDVYLRGGEIVRMGSTTLRVDLVQGRGAAPQTTGAVQFGRIHGASPEMKKLYPTMEKLAQSEVPVILEGETGTGKELLAEALHEASPRASGPFVVFDCTAVPPNQVEEVLFGHEAGVGGASAPRKGVFELAHGGTLFIDEIGDLDVSVQPKLLRALERSEIQRIGAQGWTRVDVRVIAATRRDLDREVQDGKFRDDLYFRLAVARIELPPLRRRTGDVATLAEHFWRQATGGGDPLPEDFLPRFEDYSWPGNVRELQNAVARRVALGVQADDVVRKGGDAPPASQASSAGAPSRADVIESVLGLDLPLSAARAKVVDEFERRYVERVLERHGGNVARAAAASGIARRYFQLLRARQQK